jgi:hypothetical protein
MLKSLYYDEPGDPAISRTITGQRLAKALARPITGQWLAKAQFDSRMRARLAAEWVSGELEVKPTVKAAVAIFGVSQPLISAALADLGAPARKGKRKAAAKTANGNGNGNGNGHGDYVVVHDNMPFVPNADDLWSHMSDDERQTFVREHAASIWSTLDTITA